MFRHDFVNHTAYFAQMPPPQITASFVSAATLASPSARGTSSDVCAVKCLASTHAGALMLQLPLELLMSTDV